MTTEAKLYAVSSGDGNNGVSHMFPDYYVRTNDPYRLAALAMVSSFQPEFKQAAADAVEVDGEADHTIFATIYNPEDVDPSEAPERECDCGVGTDSEDEEHSEDCAMFSDDDNEEMYCNVNGAWQIIDVFPADEPREGMRIYDSLEDAFDTDDLALVPEEN